MDGKNLSRYHINVRGRVQGVCFRMYTREKANDLGLLGFVRNLPDGSVEIVAEGEKLALFKLIDWASIGPPSAKVTELKKREEQYLGEFKAFNITI